MYKPKYKVGDKVRIRPDLNINIKNVANRMVLYAGNEVTIDKIISDYPSVDMCYYILEDYGFFKWGDNMLVPLPTFKRDLLKNLKENSCQQHY